MKNTETELRELKYLTQPQIDEILGTFRLLGMNKFGPYPGADEFTKRIEQASSLRSDGIEYSVSTSTSEDR